MEQTDEVIALHKLPKRLSIALIVELISFTSAACASSLYDSGMKAYRAGDYKLARSLFAQEVKASPKNANAIYLEANCAAQLNDWSTAKQLYAEVVRIDPRSSAGVQASSVLQKLGIRPALAATVSSSAPNSIQTESLEPAQVKDLASLPDSASFYFTKEGSGHMAVALQVNGYPVKAYFDTGAGAFFYRDQLVAAGVNCNNAQPAGFTHGWAGKPVQVSAMIAEVKLGNLTRKIRIIMQEGGDEGLHQNLIGQDLVRGYQYEIEDKAGRVDLRKSISTTSQTLDPMYDVPCKFEDRRDIVQIEVNGHSISAFIDTGASMSMIDPETARSVGLEMTGGTQNLQGVGGNFSAELGTARVRIGPVVKDSFLFRVGGTAGTCIGQDFMEGWRFKADREHSLLRFFH